MKPSRNRNFSDLSSKARKNTDVFSITVGKAPEVAIGLHGCSRYCKYTCRCKSTKDNFFFLKSQSRKIKNMKTTKRKAKKQLAIIEIKVRFKGQGQLEM